MRKQLVSAIAAIVIMAGPAASQDNGPAIVPEELQRLALKFPIAERLKIDWNSAGPDDVGRYLGFLAATNEVAITVANSNDRKEPSEVDFLAALAVQCIWPPNKPPLVEESWPLQEPAFFNASVRQAIRDAVGPTAKALPFVIEKLGQTDFAASAGELPTEAEQYFQDVFNVQKLGGEK